MSTDKDILKIPTDSSSAGQQLKNSKIYKNSLINRKVAFILKALWKILKLKFLGRKIFFLEIFFNNFSQDTLPDRFTNFHQNPRNKICRVLAGKFFSFSKIFGSNKKFQLHAVRVGTPNSVSQHGVYFVNISATKKLFAKQF